MKIVIECNLHPSQSENDLASIIAGITGVREASFTILRKSLDARRGIVWRYRCCVDVPEAIAWKLIGEKKATAYSEETPFHIPRINTRIRIPIVGCGPAGLFCALTLVKAGVAVDIYERGKTLKERHKDVMILNEKGVLNEESNVVFGEGGAGTYSDGKLTTRIHRKEVRIFYDFMVKFGAPNSILYEAKPHIGTDKLVSIIENMRNYLLQHDCTVQFNKKLTDIIVDHNSLYGLRFNHCEEIRSSIAIVATGHSARDVYTMLYNRGIALQKKGFAVGVRVEHPRELIDTIQYKGNNKKYNLPAADYSLTFKDVSGRGVYTFCMCPGGVIINSSSQSQKLCINGMSYAARDGDFSNAALVVTVHPDDFSTILDGMYFQMNLEEKAFTMGGGSFRAPAQRIPSFLKKSIDASLPSCTYRPGVIAANVAQLLPEWLYQPLQRAIIDFDSKMKGFITEDGLIVGVETRTSSPLRIVRNETFESVSCKGLYPIGEGAGYAGGIVSSAVDGIRVAFEIIKKLQGE